MRLVTACVLTLVVCCWAWPETSASLKQSLSRQRFSGELAGNVHVTRLGSLVCSGKNLQVLYYEWEESHPPGAAIHAQYRILFMDAGSHYLGSYVVEDRPTKVGPTSIRFGYPERLENSIGCNKQGLPSRVLLNGELQVFSK